MSIEDPNCLTIGAKGSLYGMRNYSNYQIHLQLGYRFAHILRRMLPIAMFLLQKEGQSLTGHDLFLKKVGSAFQNFIESAEKGCRGKCLEDLQSTTRYVTWSLHTKSKTSLKAMLGKVVDLIPTCISCIQR